MNDWLVMLFLEGDNELFPFGQNLLDEATLVGSSDRVAVVAERGPARPGEKEATRGPLLTGQHQMVKMAAAAGATNGSHDISKILDFVEDSVERYEARNRALILWDHGNGWQNVHSFDRVVAAVEAVKQRRGLYGVPADDGTAPSSEQLFVSDLRTVLDPDRGIAVVGFDSCLMSMIEVAFQLRDTAQFMIASQHIVPAARGWAYEALLRALTLNSRMNAEELVRTAVDTFAGSYNGLDNAVTLTGIRLSSEVDRAVSAIDSFSMALLGAIAASDEEGTDVRTQLAYARRYTQQFGNPDYVDLYSFCEQIEKRLPDEHRLIRTAEFVKSAIERLVVRHTRSGAASIDHANGISIYFPQTYPGAKLAKAYAQLDFANTLYCSWSTFLHVLVEGAAVDLDKIARRIQSAARADDMEPAHGQCSCCQCAAPAKKTSATGVVQMSQRHPAASAHSHNGQRKTTVR